jgi:hypothetical protein
MMHDGLLNLTPTSPTRLKPIVRIGVTISFNFKLQRIVVLPEASRPTINTLCSGEANNLVSIVRILDAIR